MNTAEFTTNVVRAEAPQCESLRSTAFMKHLPGPAAGAMRPRIGLRDQRPLPLQDARERRGLADPVFTQPRARGLAMISAIPEVRSRLTGRAQVRSGWFGRRVLQVEVQVEYFDSTPRSPRWFGARRVEPPPSLLHTRKVWRDATWLDLQRATRLVIGQL